MFDFIKRSRLVKRGLASGKTRRRINKNELLHTLESAASVKWVIFAAFIGGLAVLIFSGQQPEPTKNFVISLLFFATAVTQLWINQPTTFVRSSRILLVFGVIFLAVYLVETRTIACDQALPHHGEGRFVGVYRLATGGGPEPPVYVAAA